MPDSANPKRPWLRRMVALLALIVFSYAGLAIAVARSERIQSGLAWRLSTAFGRAVEVSRFELGLLDGPRLVAIGVTIPEDPRFGYEHFLRADSLVISLRWTALLRGRLEFGTLSFERPSVNLVRNPDGQWNLENWLPPLPQAAGEATAGSESRQTAPAARAQLRRVNIEGGRINFKRGFEKHPFAFINVEGTIEQQRPGAWRLDLEAGLMRAAVPVQDSGIVRLRGQIGGPESRLRPVDLQLTWDEVPLSDALRLAAGFDYGVRGTLYLTLAARSAEAAADKSSPFEWRFQGSARLAGVHRWDLPPRPRDPSVNLSIAARWLPEQARAEFTRLVLEGPASSIRGMGYVAWAEPPNASLRLLSSGISLNDLLDWHRAFRPQVAEGVRAEGSLGLDAELSGWPRSAGPQARGNWFSLVKSAVLATDGGLLHVPGSNPDSPLTLRLGRTVLRRASARGVAGTIELQPATLSLSAPSEVAPAKSAAPKKAGKALVAGAVQSHSLRIEGWLRLEPEWPFSLELSGQTERADRWLTALTVLGWPQSEAEDAQAAVAPLRYRWGGTLRPFVLQHGARPIRTTRRDMN